MSGSRKSGSERPVAGHSWAARRVFVLRIALRPEKHAAVHESLLEQTLTFAGISEWKYCADAHT